MQYCASVVELWRESSNCISCVVKEESSSSDCLLVRRTTRQRRSGRVRRRRVWFSHKPKIAQWEGMAGHMYWSHVYLYIPLFFLFFFFFLCIPTKVYYDYCRTESFLSRVPSSSVLEDVSEVCSLLLQLWSHGWCVFLLLCSSLFISVLVCVLVLARARAPKREREREREREAASFFFQVCRETIWERERERERQRLHHFSFKFAAQKFLFLLTKDFSEFLDICILRKSFERAIPVSNLRCWHGERKFYHSFFFLSFFFCCCCCFFFFFFFFTVVSRARRNDFCRPPIQVCKPCSICGSVDYKNRICRNLTRFSIVKT